MANGLMEANMASQVATSAYQTLLKALEISEAILTTREGETIVETIEKGIPDDKFSTLFVARDMKDIFCEMADKKDLFYIIAGNEYKIDGQDYKFIDNDPLSEYLMVKTLKPTPLLDENNKSVLDESGKMVFTPESENNFRELVIIQSKLNHEYLENRAREIASSHKINTNKANELFNDKDTVTISNLSMADCDILQEAAENLKIDTFAFFDKNSMNYNLELSKKEFMRNPILPDMMSPAEELIMDYSLAKNVPEINKQIEHRNSKHELLSGIINDSKIGLSDEYTLVCTKDLEFDLDHGCVMPPPLLIKFYDSYCEVASPTGFDQEAFDLRDSETRDHILNIISKIGNEYEILETKDCDKALGLWATRVDEFNNVIDGPNGQVWMPNFEKELFDELIGNDIKAEREFDEILKNSFAASENLRDMNLCNLKVNDYDDNKMVEIRIPDSTKIMAETVIECSDKLDDSFTVLEQIKHNIDKTLSEFNISLAENYDPTKVYVKADKTEIFNDNSNKVPINKNEYLESLTESVENYDPQYDIAYENEVIEDFELDNISPEEFDSINGFFDSFNESIPIDDLDDDFDFDFSKN